ncbi:MAG TPA: hypothetical protein VGF14_05780, partial [Alphaproteobacteria bacterium]
ILKLIISFPWLVIMHIWVLLRNEKMPVWLSLLLFGLTAWGTYSLAPKVNYKFEQQRIITSYVEKNLDNFNLLSRELISEISVFNNTLKHNIVDQKSLAKIQAKITELQWRALELDIIFADKKSLSIIKEYKQSLNNLGVATNEARCKSDAENITYKVIPFADSSMKIIDALAKKAGLK